MCYEIGNECYRVRANYAMHDLKIEVISYISYRGSFLIYFLVHQVSIQNSLWPKIYNSANNIAAKHPVKEKKL